MCGVALQLATLCLIRHRLRLISFLEASQEIAVSESMTKYQTGGTVPETGKYRCRYCGPDGGAAQAVLDGDASDAVLKVSQEKNVVRSFKKGATFGECPNCGKLPEDQTLWVRESAEDGKSEDVKPKHKESTRDTVESILFAFVLAFLFRTFEAEAFVIPTGSMAPTLYGRHKESTCSECGFSIVVGASDEVNPDTGNLWNSARLRSAICANCGFENTQLLDELAFNGDRIIVNKYPYEFGEPNRWDVFVFKWPEEPKTNYIKRLVGLPGETIRIRGGNLHTWDGESERILRKDPWKQRSVQIPVYDNKHAPRSLIEAGWPERWAGVRKGEIGRVAGWTETDQNWSLDPSTRSFSLQSSAELEWLRYRHFHPGPSDWEDLNRKQPLDPRARLIGDLCGYNNYIGDNIQHFEAHTAEGVDHGPYWVGDLTLHGTMEVDAVNEDAEIVLELCEGTFWYRCRINPQSGAATMEEINVQLNERVQELGTATTSIDGPGTYSFSFANVDDRLCVWINGALADFGEGTQLDRSGATVNPFPTSTDLTPVALAARGVSLQVSDLLIERDIYYRADFPMGDPRFHGNKRFERDLTRYLHDPESWAEVYLQNADRLDILDIEVGEDHYLALGDNSPRSRDSRLWEEGMRSVPRKYLVGKAFWIYWPHGVPFLNGGRGFPVRSHYEHANGKLSPADDYPRYTLPFYPQVTRMRRIR